MPAPGPLSRARPTRGVCSPQGAAGHHESLTLPVRRGAIAVLVSDETPSGEARALLMLPVSAGLAGFTFWPMPIGVVMAAIPLLANAATGMFTFYPPLKAHWAFYVGLTLVVVGTWLVTLNLALTWRRWRAANSSTRTPLAAFMGLVTLAMWTIASLGLAAEMLVMLIPCSLGLIGGTDPLLARVLFWFIGHPIVYFWLQPAYISWYTLAPRQAGASSSATRSRGPRSSCSLSS